MKWNDEEQAREDAAREALEIALAKRKEWKVLWSRATYLIATSPSVATDSRPRNTSGAARVVGWPYASVRPYVFAGEALDRAGRLHRTTVDLVDLAIVEAAIDENANGPRRAHRRQT